MDFLAPDEEGASFFFSILKNLRFGMKGDLGRHLLWEKSHICLRSNVRR